jgi:hypothetical protein
MGKNGRPGQFPPPFQFSRPHQRVINTSILVSFLFLLCLCCKSTPSTGGKENARRPVSRVLSAPESARRPFLLDAPRGAPHATNPDSRARMPLRLATPPSLFGLAPGGVYHAAPVARRAVRFYRPVSPLPAGCLATLARAVCFLWHCPWGRPRRSLTGTVFPWSPDFPLPLTRQRPSSRLAGQTCMALRRASSRAERPLHPTAPCGRGKGERVPPGLLAS